MTQDEYRDKARRMLIQDEGLRLRAYKCTAGFNTLGVGRNLDAKGVKGLILLKYMTVGITKAKALEWLDEDIKAAELDCEAIFGEQFYRWSPLRRLGWVNLAFNLGRVRLEKFVNTIRWAKSEEWAKVHFGLTNALWYRQVKSRGPRVVALICEEKWVYD